MIHNASSRSSLEILNSSILLFRYLFDSKVLKFRNYKIFSPVNIASIWYQSRFITIVAHGAVTNWTIATFLMMAARTRSKEILKASLKSNQTKNQMKCFIPYGRSLETDSITDSIVTIFGITIVNSLWTELIFFLGRFQHILTITDLSFKIFKLWKVSNFVPE